MGQIELFVDRASFPALIFATQKIMQLLSRTYIEFGDQIESF